MLNRKLCVAINGFGRIGRSVFKALLEDSQVEVVAINDLTDNKTLAHLLQYDSCYGKYEKTVSFDEEHLIVDGQEFLALAEKDPAILPWGKLGVDIVIESTGRFTKAEDAMAHIKAGAKKVIISAPAKDEATKNIVLSVNEKDLLASDQVISMASCTTNCLAPITKVMTEKLGVEKAVMSTIHAYTADQNLVDGPHKDLRRARSAAMSIVPTTTGAAVAVAKTVPEMSGRFDGSAFRVPTPVVSLCDVVMVTKRQTSIEEVNQLLSEAAGQDKFGALTVTSEPLVSIDFTGNPASSIVDLGLTKVVGGDLVKIVAWYDNEWGYSHRLANLCSYIADNDLL
ncbi:MAG TPA: type I glyceraldehyde-3-phosphate dehydrogenase [bacterium]|nr:type I glyceraldehyde-3-phosphate dehydrogenase [bacterium]